MILEEVKQAGEMTYQYIPYSQCITVTGPWKCVRLWAHFDHV